VTPVTEQCVTADYIGPRFDGGVQMKRCPSCKSAFPTGYTHCPNDGSTLADTGEWVQGTLVRGKYQILGKVGQGGMGSVYKAMHVRFNELRALKVISPELASDPAFVRRFEQEAITTRKLQHPNAVRVEDIDESENGRPFIVMEYIEGRNLKDVIEQEAPLPVFRTCSIVKQVAAALDAAHALGIVHRDIKPGNIALVTSGKEGGPQNEQAKVFDFGIAKLKEDHLGSKAQPISHLTLTGTGVVIGTPAYMSPEQAKGLGASALDGRSDLYSLGVVMYQMLTGELPLKADSTIEQLMAHINTPPKPIREARPDLDIPDAVAAVVMWCLEKNRDLRPATGHALNDALRLAEYSSSQLSAPVPAPTPKSAVSREIKPFPLKSTTAAAVPSPPAMKSDITATAAPPVVPSRRWPWVWVTAAVLVVSAVSANSWYLVKEHRLRVEEIRRAAETAELTPSPLPTPKPDAGVVPPSPPNLATQPSSSSPAPQPLPISSAVPASNPRINPPAGSIPKKAEVKAEVKKDQVTASNVTPPANQPGPPIAANENKPSPMPGPTNAPTPASNSPTPASKLPTPPATPATEAERIPEPGKPVAVPAANAPSPSYELLGDRAKSWLDSQREAPAINVNGDWESEVWGDLRLNQVQGSREVSGNTSSYDLTGVVSGKRLFLLFHSSGGKIDYCATLNSEAGNKLSGGYSSRVTRLRFGHGLCQEKSRPMQIVKK